MHSLWKKLLSNASDLLPDFNDDLLLNFRARKISLIKNYLNDLFQESVKMLNGKLKYLGWQEMSPDECIEYIRENPVTKKRIEVQKSTFELVKFNFEFEGIIHPVYIKVPFLDHGVIWLGDTAYYPLFPEVERGGLHRTNHNVIVKVMRAPITFKRTESFSFTTDKGMNYRESVITVKIHQRKRGRGNKRTDRTPLILYHLTKNTFDEVMRMYGFAPGEISIVGTYEASDKFSYIKIKEGIWLKVLDTAFSNINKRRVIASYLTCLAEYPRFDLRDLLTTHLSYYWTVLGKYTYPNSTNAQLLFDNARKHLETTDTLLDPPAQYQLAQIGINVKNIYELLFYVFFNLDNWMVSYDPTNLYEKKIGALDQIMAPLVSLINNKLFMLVNDRDEGMTHETVKKFTTSASQHESWMMGNSTFRANPSICNDCWLIAIGANRFRSLENTETKSNNSGGNNMPIGLLTAHPSQLAVESILCLPPSARIGALQRVIVVEQESELLEYSKAC